MGNELTEYVTINKNIFNNKTAADKNQLEKSNEINSNTISKEKEDENKKKKKVLSIQKVFRGFLGRRRFHTIKIQTYLEKKRKKISIQNAVQFKSTWDMFFPFNFKYEFTVGGLNNLKKDLSISYSNFFTFKGSQESFIPRVFKNIIFTKEDIKELKSKGDFISLFKAYFLIKMNEEFDIYDFVEDINVASKFFFEGISRNKRLDTARQLYRMHTMSKIKPVLLIKDKNIKDIPFFESILDEFTTEEQSFCIINSFQDPRTKVYYQGSFNEENNMKYGLGKEYFMDNSADNLKYKYCGYYKNNKYHGIGILIKEDGECYYGEFRDGAKNGYGYLINKDSYYKGFFKDNLQEGYGEVGNRKFVYNGGFHKGKFNGYGFMNKDGVFRVCGNFIDDKVNGGAYYEWPDGDKYYGEWKNNRMHGEGIFYFKNGDVFKGTYENDFKNGDGEYTYKNGSVLKGKWIKGKKEGKFILDLSNFSKNVTKKEIYIYYKNDQQINIKYNNSNVLIS